MKKRVYLDYAASTPVDPRVLRAMEPYFMERFGNPGSLHSFGQEAIAAVDRSRETIARTVAANFREIIFTGSATEANNLALRGTVRGFRWKVLGERNPILTPNTYNLKPKVIISAIEHESIFETARDLEAEGVEVVVVPVNREGLVDMKVLEPELDERTAVVSVMYVNNEIGTVQPITEISKAVRNFRGEKSSNPEPRTSNGSVYPLFHTDAAQAFHVLPCNIEGLGVDLMTLSAHKIGGPKGIGALYVRGSRIDVRTKLTEPRTSIIEPVTTGGGQEFGFRSGTENVPAIVGFAEAVRIANRARQKEGERLRALMAHAWSGVRVLAPASRVNGISPSRGENRAPHITNIYIPAMSAEELLTRLDLLGVSLSSGSACASRSFEPSHVIQALGYTGERARHSVRLSIGRETTPADIKQFLTALKKSLKTNI